MVGCFRVVQSSCSSISVRCAACTDGDIPQERVGYYFYHLWVNLALITKWFLLYYKTPAIRMFIQPDFVLGWLGSLCPSALIHDAMCTCAGGAAAQKDTPEPPSLLRWAVGAGLLSPSLYLPLLGLGQTFHCAYRASEHFRRPGRLCCPPPCEHAGDGADSCHGMRCRMGENNCSWLSYSPLVWVLLCLGGVPSHRLNTDE